MIVSLLFARMLTSQAILTESQRRIEEAKSIVVTTRYFFEEVHKHETIKHYWIKKGGYYRCEESGIVDVGNPHRGWEYRNKPKSYSLMPGIPASYSPWHNIFCLVNNPKLMPTIGSPRALTWHGRHVVRVEVDGTKAMTKETKLFLFFEPKTYLPVGVSANLGSATQITIFDHLKLNTKIDDKRFRWVPPKSWVEQSVPTGTTS